MRAGMLCGYLPESEWTASMLGEFDISGEPYSPPICPGWMIRQDAVIEIADAWHAMDRGALALAYPDPTNTLIDGVLMLDRAIAEKRHKDYEKKPGE